MKSIWPKKPRSWPTFVYRTSVTMLLSLTIGIATTIGPAMAQIRQSPSVARASDCYSGQHATPPDDPVTGEDTGNRWLGTGIVQMSLRQISLLVDADSSFHGYQIDKTNQEIVIVHDQTADAALVATKVERAMAIAVDDVEDGSESSFPAVVAYPACRRIENATNFTQLEDSVAAAEWTDEPVFELIGLALERDLVTTQLVATMEESNASTDRITSDLLTSYDDDVRVVIDPTHRMFNYELLAMPGHERTNGQIESDVVSKSDTDIIGSATSAPLNVEDDDEAADRTDSQTIGPVTATAEHGDRTLAGLPPWSLPAGVAALIGAATLLVIGQRMARRDLR